MKDYVVQFGSGNPSSFSGLSPTFTLFAVTASGATITPPGITEIIGSGLYRFNYGPTLGFVFICDGGAGLASGDRFVVGTLDPIQAVDEKVGTTGDSFGSTLTDPSTLFGYQKRTQEFLEGNASFTKSTGTWLIYSRGSSILLTSKTLTNTTSTAGKT